jgi:DNA-binding GntR family transcriptional regulator
LSETIGEHTSSMHTGRYTAPSGLRSDIAYLQLKTRLLRGEYAVNVRLGEERIAAMLEVSRTPVREALVRLFAEGLVSRSADGGYSPVAPDVTDMKYLYELRATLELQSLRRPVIGGTRHDLGLLESLRDDWRTLAASDHDHVGPDFVLLDESFHLTLSEAAGNPVATEYLRHVNERIRLVRMQDFLTLDRVQDTVAQHLGIVESVLVGDVAEAERRFVLHLDESAAVVEQRVTQAVARMLAKATES